MNSIEAMGSEAFRKSLTPTSVIDASGRRLAQALIREKQAICP